MTFATFANLTETTDVQLANYSGHSPGQQRPDTWSFASIEGSGYLLH
ncbi:hypothetical protein [Streptomyces sp. NRRL WC-3618]|nr:hypothetical protein [Streptomyces sp. NRRL WC-3618]